MFVSMKPLRRNKENRERSRIVSHFTFLKIQKGQETRAQFWYKKQDLRFP